MRIWWLAIFVAWGCSDDTEYPLPNPDRVSDISGATYGWSCEAGVGCNAHYIAESPPPPECDDDERPSLSYTMGASRFFPLYTICAWQSGGWFINDFESRFLVCATEDDCPQLAFTGETMRWDCVHGLCQRAEVDQFPRDVLTEYEAFLLCLNQVPRVGETSLDVYDRIAQRVFEYCPEDGPECEAPPECAQP